MTREEFNKLDLNTELMHPNLGLCFKTEKLIHNFGIEDVVTVECNSKLYNVSLICLFTVEEEDEQVA